MLSASAFVTDMIAENVLEFGEFTLKSGKKSPYFFNLGRLSSGQALRKIGYAFARRIMDLNLQPDVLYGPAYKGIPLATAAAMELDASGMDVDTCFNRKEVKSHGEGGVLVGGNLESARVLIVDDVITDGASKVSACELIREHKGIPTGILVALDRMEFDDTGQRSSLESLEEKMDLPIYSVATLKDILRVLESKKEYESSFERLVAYASKNCAIELD